MPDVTMGEIPSSMSVPRLDARMTRIQYSGSELSLDMMPYSGICEATKKIMSTIAVHMMRCWNGTLRSGGETSGSTDMNGRTNDRKRTVCEPARIRTSTHLGQGGRRRRASVSPIGELCTFLAFFRRPPPAW